MDFLSCRTITNFLNNLISSNNSPTNIRCEIYKEQIKDANKRLDECDLSKRDRRKLSKEKKSAIEGIERADLDNKEFITRSLTGLAITGITMYKIIKYLNRTN